MNAVNVCRIIVVGDLFRNEIMKIIITRHVQRGFNHGFVYVFGAHDRWIAVPHFDRFGEIFVERYKAPSIAVQRLLSR